MAEPCEEREDGAVDPDGVSKTPFPMRCMVATTFVIPRLEMLSAQSTQTITDLRLQSAQLDKLWVWKDESLRRLQILETAAVEQQKENRRVEQVVYALKHDVAQLQGKMDDVQHSLGLLVHSFEKHGIDMKAAFVKETKRHEKLMRVGMTFAGTAAAGVGLLVALHNQATGTPLLETLLTLFRLNP